MVRCLLVPWIFSAIYILPISPFPGLDLPPIGFAITGLLVIEGMRRFHLLDVVPVARHFLVESMADVLLVLDARDRVVDVNPTARALMGHAVEVIGRRVDDVPGPLGAAIAGLRDQAVEHVEMSLPGDPGRYIDMRLSPLFDRDGSTSWRGLERYIMDHSDAQFSHDICPDCMRKLYPDLAE